VSTSSAACHSTSASRFHSAAKTTYLNHAIGSGSYKLLTKAPGLTGCYAWGATVTYAGGVKAVATASGRSAVFVS
jgi:hypothetical protein